jgi:hypothetical protein
LGLPFLSVNNIVADFTARTAIDKRCEYDLLNPPARIKFKRLMEPSVSVVDVKKNKRDMLQELILVCNERLKNGKGVPEVVKPLNVAAMIREHIEVLALQEKFGSLEKAFYQSSKMCSSHCHMSISYHEMSQRILN